MLIGCLEVLIGCLPESTDGGRTVTVQGATSSSRPINLRMEEGRRKEGGRRKDEGRRVESILVGAVPHAVARVVGFSSFIHSFIRSIKLNAYCASPHEELRVRWCHKTKNQY